MICLLERSAEVAEAGVGVDLEEVGSLWKWKQSKEEEVADV